MEIRKATIFDLDGLYSFNEEMYPKRKNVRQIVDFWISKSKDEINNIVIAVDENNTIRGQQFFSSMYYYREGKRIDSTWAFDLVVDQELRSKSEGFALMWKCKKFHPNNLSSGSNDISLPINLKIGNKHIGNLKKYVGVTSLFYLPTSIFRGLIKTTAFPDKILYKEAAFVRSQDVIANIKTPYNKDLIEFGRDSDFMKWRFFNKLHEYVIYRNINNDDYFVVRSIVKKGITALALIDYRCDVNSSRGFKEIMIAFRYLAKRLHIAIVITGSSLAIIDKVCDNYNMKAIGRNRPILGLIDCDGKQSLIDNRDFVFLTLADSDGEVSW